MKLYEDERLDYLLNEEMRIIQSPNVFAFSLDAVLLSNFVYVPIQKGKIMDLCSGNGVIPLLLSKRTKGQLVGVEIQERLYDMAVRSVEYNKLTDRIQMVLGDLKDAPKTVGNGIFDVVTCNPPYFQMDGQADLHANPHYAIARHELLTTLEDVVKTSSSLVKQGGKVAFVHRPNRLLDIVTLMRKYRLEPKRLQFVHPKRGKEANTILIEGIKDGKPDLKILPPIAVYEEDNSYTKELKEMLYLT
ncbi:tRNA1(Val) (adenine(37)-N6)-methyltransferase [Massilibacterium senegalense]|uniref:tRNA1(Val) (adenine(37)-N6)-methyltransferase n=1 Tax=Massilibacterium senegalense TaxID=1632858 RepID=UPI000781BBE7|nr:tRNA1(Val) (adenine(37)-N6)-methyltransferase [Massilibacterium senegalense]